MTQMSQSKVLDLAKYLATKAGTELADFLQYVSELADQVIRILRNGITFTDNFDAKFMEVTLTSGTAQAINVGSKRAKMILVAQVVSLSYALDTFLWYLDGDGSCKVKAAFTGTPTAPITVVLLICYG